MKVSLRYFLFLFWGGESIQKECREHVEAHGALLPGNVFVSKSGQLSCKAIIHAAGPKWNGGNQKEADHLFDAVFDSMNAAQQRNLKSIAIPAISTGLFGYPLEEACKVILQAICEYYKCQAQLPSEVHLVSNDDHTVNTFQEAAVSTFGSSRTETLDYSDAGTVWGHQPQKTAATKRKSERMVFAFFSVFCFQSSHFLFISFSSSDS